MPMVLPVPAPAEDEDRYRPTAAEWERAAPDYDGPQIHAPSRSVARYRTGPGDENVGVDQWLGININDVPHDGVENGRGLFVQIPGPPPEGHGGYDFPDTDKIIDRSTTRQALFWSDWNASTALTAGGRGAFTGEHVVVRRIPPGSVQGYMPSDPGIVQANNARNAPEAWDSNIVIGQYPQGPAAVSM